MGPLFVSESEGESSDHSPPSKKPRKDRAPTEPYSAATLRDNQLRTGFSSAGESGKNLVPTQQDLRQQTPAIQRYIKELEDYRDTDIDNHGTSKEIRKQEIQALEEERDRIQNLVDNMTRQVTVTQPDRQIQRLTDQVNGLKADLAAKDEQLKASREKNKEYLNTLLNVLPPLVEAEKERDRRLEGVEVKNEELTAEIDRYKEKNMRLADENRRLEEFRERINEAVSKVRER